MNINFIALSNSDFPLLLKWLRTPHVKAWWDSDINYTEDLLKAKYSSYVDGYKLENSEEKTISAFIIYVDNNPIGYIQIYNAYDFARKTPMIDLPKSLAAIDFFIGDADYIGKGIGAEILRVFDYQGYKNILVDPDIGNIAAIKTYKKAGFKKIREQPDSNEIWMLKENG
jgi:RimJ/RimL family protein N-acetyltransferase